MKSGGDKLGENEVHRHLRPEVDVPVSDLGKRCINRIG